MHTLPIVPTLPTLPILLVSQWLLGRYRSGLKVVAAQGERIDLALVQSVAVLLTSFALSLAMLNLHGPKRVVLGVNAKLDTGHVFVPIVSSVNKPAARRGSPPVRTNARLQCTAAEAL
jgi:hypothetical protein